MEARNSSASVRRALLLVRAIGERAGGTGITLADLARSVEINKSTALRLLRPLMDEGLVAQDETTSRYRLGYTIVTLAQALLEDIEVRRIAAPLLRELMRSVGETVHLVLFEAPHVVYIDKIEAARAVRMHSRIGQREPCYCTAVGKAILANRPPEDTDAVIENGLVRRTETTITAAEALRKELVETRRRGYAVDDMENEMEVRCVAAPLFDYQGDAFAAISVSGPASRITKRRVARLGDEVMATAGDISKRLGAKPPDATRSGKLGSSTV